MRRSTTGALFKQNGASTSFKSILHAIVTLSTAESNYIALSTKDKELTWIIRLTAEIKENCRIDREVSMSSIPIFTEITAAESIASTSNINARAKNIYVRFHHVRDMVGRS